MSQFIQNQDMLGAAEVAPDRFTVVGRLNTRGDGTAQPRYNLLVLGDAVANLEALAAEFDFQCPNENGEHWIKVTIDARSKANLRRGTAGASMAVIEGELTVVDVLRGNPRGTLTIRQAAPASLRNGGRVIKAAVSV